MTHTILHPESFLFGKIHYVLSNVLQPCLWFVNHILTLKQSLEKVNQGAFSMSCIMNYEALDLDINCGSNLKHHSFIICTRIPCWHISTHVSFRDWLMDWKFQIPPFPPLAGGCDEYFWTCINLNIFKQMHVGWKSIAVKISSQVIYCYNSKTYQSLVSVN